MESERASERASVRESRLTKKLHKSCINQAVIHILTLTHVLNQCLLLLKLDLNPFVVLSPAGSLQLESFWQEVICVRIPPLLWSLCIHLGQGYPCGRKPIWKDMFSMYWKEARE